MVREWITPRGVYYNLYKDMLEQSHLLIAGATGSGKSVVINGMIHTALLQAPSDVQFILIDPKRVELIDYKDLPHTSFYASDLDNMIRGLQMALDTIEMRFEWMQERRIKQFTGTRLYVVIDELADLMTTAKKYVVPLIQRIAQIGRAAGVHLICATQCPLAKIIPTEIKVNFDAKFALRTQSPQDSRNIIGFKGCEVLPRYGKAYYSRPEGVDLVNVPMYKEISRNGLIDYWMRQVRRPRFRF